MKKNVYLFTILCLTATLLFLTACGADEAARLAPESAAENWAFDADDAEFMLHAAVGEAPPTEDGRFASDEYGGTTAVPAEMGHVEATPVSRIIFQAQTSVETTAFDDAVTSVYVLIDQHRGFIQESDVTGRNYHAERDDVFVRRAAFFLLRVPSDRYDTMLRDLDDLGATLYLHTQAEDVSDRYADIQSRLGALRAQEARILALLEQADNMIDILELERRLGELIFEIERFTASRNQLDQRIAYSTIHLRLIEVEVYTEEEEYAEPTFSDRIAETFRTTTQVMQVVGYGLILVLVALLPWLGTAAAIAVPIILLVRRKRRRTKFTHPMGSPSPPLMNTPETTGTGNNENTAE